jgi:phage tail-like protein
MALLSQTGVRLDPVLNHNFVISLIDSSSLLGSLTMSAIFDVALGGFNECSGLEMSMQPEEYKEGGRNGTVLKFPNRVTWSNITLKKGVGAKQGLWEWHYGFVEGKGKRRDGVIVLLTDLHLPNNIWYFQRGLPVKYTGPSMNAMQNNVAIEAIEIAHEGIYQVPFVGIGAAAVGAAANLAI